MWGTPLALRNVACLAAGPSGWPIDSVRRSIPDRPQGCWWHSCLARGGEVCGDEERGAQEVHTWEAVPQLSPQTRAGACRRLLVPPRARCVILSRLRNLSGLWFSCL